MSRWISTNKKLIPLYAEMSGYETTQRAQVIFEFQDGIPIAGALFDYFNGQTIHSHIWIAQGRRPSRVWWWTIHDYVFNQAKAQLAVGSIKSTNERMIKLAESMGYSLHSKMENYYPDGADMLFYIGTAETATHWQRYRNGAPAPKYERMPA